MIEPLNECPQIGRRRRYPLARGFFQRGRVRARMVRLIGTKRGRHRRVAVCSVRRKIVARVVGGGYVSHTEPTQKHAHRKRRQHFVGAIVNARRALGVERLANAEDLP